MKALHKSTVIIAIGTLAIGFGLGWLIFRDSSATEPVHEHTIADANEIWTCSMHPQIRLTEPGDCPICGMDLIPADADYSGDDSSLEIKMSPTAMQLANVQTTVVQKEKPVKSLRLNGKVQPDERLVSSQTSHITGRIEQLLVNYTGEYIRKGQIIAYVYSPQLVTAQEELFEAYKIRESQPALFQAAKGKLKNWKLTDIQIDGIIQSGTPTEDFPILSDLNGVITVKKVNLGDHVMQGAPLFEVADLTKIWILFDLYESDLPWVKLGDEIDYTVQSIPGESFKGKVSFIDPVINPTTRVAKARIASANNNKRFKPEMFVSGIINSPLNYGKESIIIPKSSVMWTGERSVVYIKSNNASGNYFAMREVTLGPSLGDRYIIKEGLEEGMEIVTNGAFSIDAAAQLAGKPSMMNPEGGDVMNGHNHGGSNTAKSSHTDNGKTISINNSAKEALQPLFKAYFQLKNDLVKDDFSSAMNSAGKFDKTLAKIEMTMFKGRSHSLWMGFNNSVKGNLNRILNANDLESIRIDFISLSKEMIRLEKEFNIMDKAVYILHCPMADNNKGADWLSLDKEILNPYFGASMISCGSVKEEI